MERMQIPKELKELALQFIESSEMVEHLRADKVSINDVIEIILYARASLADKLAALRPVHDFLAAYNAAQAALLPAEQDDVWRDEFEHSKEFGFHTTWDELDKVMQILEYALQEMTENTPPGTVFLLNGYLFEKRDAASDDWDSIPYSTFEAARKEIIEQAERYRANYDEEDDEFTCRFYTIMKWLPSDHGKMKHVVTWIVSNEGTVWFVDLNENFNDAVRQMTDRVFYSLGWNEHSITRISVPFEAGDIVTVDNRPSAPVCHAVLSSVPDPNACWRYDCCSIGAIYLDAEGMLNTSALKHDLAFREVFLPLFSCMLRLSKFTGKLPQEEAILHRVSERIKEDPALGMDEAFLQRMMEEWKAESKGSP